MKTTITLSADDIAEILNKHFSGEYLIMDTRVRTRMECVGFGTSETSQPVAYAELEVERIKGGPKG